MPPAEPRSLGQRIADTRALLIQPAVDAWVATASQASGDGQSQPYLVPLSFAWIDERAVLAMPSSSRTAKNLVQHRITRIGMGPTRDIVLRPERIQAWRESNELRGRVIMRDGEWAKG